MNALYNTNFDGNIQVFRFDYSVHQIVVKFGFVYEKDDSKICEMLTHGMQVFLREREEEEVDILL